MSVVQIILNALSSASLLNDLLKDKKHKKELEILYKNMKEYEKNLFENIDTKIKTEMEILTTQINLLKIVVRFLIFAVLILTVLFVVAAILFFIMLKTRTL